MNGISGISMIKNMGKDAKTRAFQAFVGIGPLCEETGEFSQRKEVKGVSNSKYMTGSSVPHTRCDLLP